MGNEGLSYNCISHWRCFPQLPALTALHVQGNKLSSLQGFIVSATQRTSKSVGRGGTRASKSKNSGAQRPSKVALFPRIDLLDLRDNALADIRGLESLGPDFCSDLSELSLQGNPVCERLNYEANILKRVPQLALLDGRSAQAPTSDVLLLDGTDVVPAGSRPSTAISRNTLVGARPMSPRGRLPSPRGFQVRCVCGATSLRTCGSSGIVLHFE